MSKIKKLIQEILKQGYLITLATVDDSGPWAADLIYVFDNDFNFYWLSHPGTRHSTALGGDNRVAGTVVVEQLWGKERALQIAGISSEIETPSKDLIRSLMDKEGRSISDAQADLDQGMKWYKLEPSFIELIHEEEFGREKKKIEF